MISAWLFRNPRILLLIIVFLAVSGLGSFFVLPRLEDPVLNRRVAVLSTAYPGADAATVESLVSIPFEEELQNIAEIEKIRVTSRSGISNIVMELQDRVTDVDQVWSRVKERIELAESALPEGVIDPEFEVFELKAFATILGVHWNAESEPDLELMSDYAAEVATRLREIWGTQKVQTFGDPGLRYLIELPPETLAASGATPLSIAQQIRAHLSRQPAGEIKDGSSKLPIILSDTIGSVDDLGMLLVQTNRLSEPVPLQSIAHIERGVAQAPPTRTYLNGQRALAIGVHVQNDVRLDRWSSRMEEVLSDLNQDRPAEIDLEVLFSQEKFIHTRLQSLLSNLFVGTAAVAMVVFVMMGWRSTLVITATLPLSALIVLMGLRLLEIPLHQMSVTGLIISLGLLIDNAIVIVDEVRARIRSGAESVEAMTESLKHLGMPLFGSTFTTTLAFVPIATLPGPSGEFVGTIAVSVILAINASFLLAMTIVPALTALLDRQDYSPSIWSEGLRLEGFKQLYIKSLQLVLHRPLLGILVAITPPLLGFYAASQLPEQFFPSSDRQQIHVEIELPAKSSADETEKVALEVREKLLEDARVQRVHLFVGESAPTFFYNVVPRRRSTPFYAQAILEIEPNISVAELVRSLQRQVVEEFSQARILVRQLEQGPPFDAPIEIQVRGTDLKTLTRIGQDLRQVLSETTHVIHTRSDLQEIIPQMNVTFKDRALQAIGYDRQQMAGILYTTLEGADAGAILEGHQDVPVIVRIDDHREFGIEQLKALEFHPQGPPHGGPPSGPSGGATGQSASSDVEGGTPLAAIADFEMAAEVAAITRINGRRVNEVKAYLTSGVLPSRVLQEWEERLKDSGFNMPPAYTMSYGGEAGERDEAVTMLMANAVSLFALMLLAIMLSFGSLRCTILILSVGSLTIGLGPGALWVFGFPLGFMAIVGTMGLVGVAINDSIVVLAGIRADEKARAGDPDQICEVVVHSTRHVLTTTLTTIAGFLPLILGGGGFWPPLAISIAGGVGGATLLALFFIPSGYRLLKRATPRQPWNIDSQ